MVAILRTIKTKSYIAQISFFPAQQPCGAGPPHSRGF
jgi:hypothetical protein